MSEDKIDPAIPLNAAAAAAAADPGGPSSSAPEPFRTRLACVTLNMRDRLRFINFPDDVPHAMQPVIIAVWPRGIQSTRTYAGAHEVQLRGNPWASDYSGNDAARRLVRALLEALYDGGWVLQGAVDVGRKKLSKDTLVFRHQHPPPAPCDWLSISLDQRDRLKVVDPPPPDLTAALLAAFGPAALRWHELRRDRLELKFVGTPWVPEGRDAVRTPQLLVALLETLERFGYTLYASVGQQNGQEGRDTDVLVVHRRKDWVPGMPVFHR